jgi:hypothetical protein
LTIFNPRLGSHSSTAEKGRQLIAADLKYAE